MLDLADNLSVHYEEFNKRLDGTQGTILLSILRSNSLQNGSPLPVSISPKKSNGPNQKHQPRNRKSKSHLQNPQPSLNPPSAKNVPEHLRPPPAGDQRLPNSPPQPAMPNLISPPAPLSSAARRIIALAATNPSLSSPRKSSPPERPNRTTTAKTSTSPTSKMLPPPPKPLARPPPKAPTRVRKKSKSCAQAAA